MRNSLLPEPVVPATRPWGPCFFSWRSRRKGSQFESRPIGTAKDFTGLFDLQSCLICSSSIVLTPYISRNVTSLGRENCAIASSLIIVHIFLAKGLKLFSCSLSQTKFVTADACLLSKSSPFWDEMRIILQHSLGSSVIVFAAIIIPNPKEAAFGMYLCKDFPPFLRKPGSKIIKR